MLDNHWLLDLLALLTMLFTLAVGLAFLITGVLYVIDTRQTRHAIRRNYPVIGRFRYLFEHLGAFFRQYFFAMDREELPFNRAERSWVYRAAKDIDSTVPFGSTENTKLQGTIFFVNCPFPTLSTDVATAREITLGPYCRTPYITTSLVNVSGMSYGALSKPAVKALSHGAARAGCWLNTGEGGLSSYHLEGGCDLVMQIGTANYGVRDNNGRLSEARLRELSQYNTIRMFELKLSQGAKPGKGGILPGAKVTEEIARIRGIPAYVDSISPNRHPQINSIDDLLDMIEYIRDVTGKPVGFKTVLGSIEWMEDLFTEIHRRGIESAPDFITIDGAEGGTGAAPMALMDHMGIPLTESLPLVVDKLTEYELRDRIKVIASGKLITPSRVAWALCMGADFVVNARGFMFALGCVQAMQCNKDTCPTGVTTHNPKLQHGLDPNDKTVRVASYVKNLVKEVGVIAHACGTTSPRELTRKHARMVTDRGDSIALSEIYPPPRPRLAEIDRKTG